MQSLSSWLYERNQAWLLQKDYPYVGVAKSDPVRVMELQAAQQIQLMHRKRGIIPLKRESHIIRHSENLYNTQVFLSLRIGTRSTYSIKNEVMEEGLEEGVSLQLVLSDQGWVINHICFENNVSATPYGISNIVVATPYVVQRINDGYDRKKAVEYAEKYWNTHSGSYRYFGEDDCTNFVSQALHAGGIGMNFTTSRGKGWWYRGPKEEWSLSWAVAHSLVMYLRHNKKSQGPRAEERSHAKGLEIGDVICYDWQGDGRWDHNTIVTKIDPNGEPLVNAHSVDSQHRYWEYTDSPAYEKGKTRYAFFHILN